MRRTAVYLDERTGLELGEMARQKERSKAELIGEALEPYRFSTFRPTGLGYLELLP